MKDYYKILEISETASDEVIHMAYKALVKKYHPDSNDQQDSFELNAKIQDINEAYSVLSDKDKRKRYDEQRQLEKKSVHPGFKNDSSFEEHEILKENTQGKVQKKAFKPKWYYSYPMLAITFCFFPLSLILSLIRLKSVKRQPKGYRFRTKIAAGINIAIALVLILGTLIEYQDSKWQTQYETYLSEGEFTLAKEMLDDKSETSMYARYVNDYLDLYEQYGVSVNIGEIVQKYYDQLDDKASFNMELQERIQSILPSLAEEQQIQLSEIIYNVENAKIERETEATTIAQVTETVPESTEPKLIEESNTIEETSKNTIESIETETIAERESDMTAQSETKSTESKKNTTNKASEYICGNSDSKILNLSDISSFTQDEMLLAIDEIYARHGVIFENKYRDNYFRQKSWYRPTVEQYNFDETGLNEIEKENIQFLEDVETGRIEIPSGLPSELITINICTEYKLSLGGKGKKPIKIYVDDKYIGTIGVNQYFIYEVFVDPGEHDLKVEYGMGEDSVLFDTESQAEYWYTCKYELTGVKINKGWDSHYLESDEVYMVNGEKEEEEGITLSSEEEYINYIKNAKTPTFEKNCKIGYLLESIMTNSNWQCEIGSNQARVFYTGNYDSEAVEITFVFKEDVRVDSCKIGDTIYESNWDILDVFSGFENDYLEELNTCPYLKKYYESLSLTREPEKTLMDQDYILPDSDKRYYTAAELENLSAEELRYARNEIYARHGLIFDDWDLKNYFLQKSWYHGSNSIRYFDDSCFNEYERANLQLIIDVENN